MPPVYPDRIYNGENGHSTGSELLHVWNPHLSVRADNDPEKLGRNLA